MRLSPSIYWEKFNSLTRETSETFQQFATRLMSLFDLYLESRKVGNSYEKLFDLIIYDCIKSAEIRVRYELQVNRCRVDGEHVIAA